MVGAAGQTDSTKTLHQGKEYDYVFSVDIAEGQPPLKLPYNVTDDPWQAAQKFIHDNDLSQYYLDTVANFIITNSKGSAPSSSAPSSGSGQTYTDPFTGQSRYVPSYTNSAPAATSSTAAVDPFTGAGRYVPGSNSVAAPSTGKPKTFFPVKDFVRFDQANIDAITSKNLKFTTLLCYLNMPLITTFIMLKASRTGYVRYSKISLLLTDKLKEFNGAVASELQLSESELKNYVKSAEIGSLTSGEFPHLDKVLRWPSGK